MTYQSVMDVNAGVIRRNRMIVKSYLGSSNLITLAVLHILSLVVSFITPILTSPIANSIFSELYYEMGIDAPATTSFNISLPVLPVLTIISLFLLYFAGKNQNPDTPNSAGATILLVVSIIQLVVLCLALLGIVLVSVLLIAFGSMLTQGTLQSYSYSYGLINGNKDASSLVFLVVALVLIILIGILVLSFVNTIGMIRLSSSIKKGLTSTELTAKGAKAVGVTNIIYAVFSGFSIIVTPFAILFSRGYTVYFNRIDDTMFLIYLFLSVFSCVLVFLTYISTAKFALSYSKHIQAETPAVPYSQIPPVYPSPAQPANTPAQPVNHPVQHQPAPQSTENSTQCNCPACGKTTIPNQAFCAECGTKLN